jgi:heme/copper-type cytochrome/quinol oxidase subunit 2
VALAVILFLVLRDGDDSGSDAGSTTKPVARESPAAPVKIEVREGRPVGGVREIEVTRGDRVRLRVESDVAEEVHVHGYDLKQDVAAGGTASFDFRATLEGVFEVELEGAHTRLAELRVIPG